MLPQQVAVVQDRNPDRWAGREIHDGKSVWCVCMGGGGQLSSGLRYWTLNTEQVCTV